MADMPPPGPQPHTGPSIWYGMLDQDVKEEVLHDVAEEVAALLEIYMDTILEAAGIRKLTGKKLLDEYRKRTSDTWAQMQQQFPQRYGHQMDDWKRLEQVAIKGGQGMTDSPVQPPGTAPAADPNAVDPWTVVNDMRSVMQRRASGDMAEPPGASVKYYPGVYPRPPAVGNTTPDMIRAGAQANALQLPGSDVTAGGGI